MGRPSGIRFAVIVLLATGLGTAGCERSDQVLGASDLAWPDASTDVDATIAPDPVGDVTQLPTPPTPPPLVRVLRPAGWTSAGGSLVSLAGIAFGEVDSIAWTTQPGGATGHATPGTWWNSDGVPLIAGDNLITVTATAGEQTSTDAVHVTYNPGYIFTNSLQVRPPALFAGEQVTVLATLGLGPFKNAAPAGTSPRLVEVDAAGAVVQELGAMVDDGMVAQSGDEIQGDGVVTLQFQPPAPTGESLRLRVAVTLAGRDADALSALLEMPVLPHLTVEACGAHHATLVAAQNAWDMAPTSDPVGARQAALLVLNADPEAAEVATFEEVGAPWVMWNDGVLGALNVGPKGDRGGAGNTPPAPPPGGGTPVPVLGHGTMLLAPFASDFKDDDETMAVPDLAAAMTCASWTMNGPFANANATLKQFRAMSDGGLVVISTHADALFGSLSAAGKAKKAWPYTGPQEVLWSREAVNCDNLLQHATSCTSDADCGFKGECLITKASYSGGATSVSGVCYDATQVDLMRGAVVMGAVNYGITPAFVNDHAWNRPYPRSLVYLGGCRTMYDGSLAAAFLANGAGAVAGYSGPVSSAFAGTVGKGFLASVLDDGKAVAQASFVGATDPAHPASAFRVWGTDELTLAGTEMLNPGFETGDLTGWAHEGDARVISKLGAAMPPEGNSMGILSTGLGFTTELGSIDQSLCVPAGTTTLTFQWKFYSEEFHEWCGSPYQDTFTATMTDQGGKESKMLYANVDALCCPKDCSGCGTFWKGAACGLVPSDIQFDQGDCHKTDWQTLTYPVGLLVNNGPVNLKFFCTDKGDSIYDTAVLIDDIRFTNGL